MKFVLFVEGHLEDKALAAFLKRWLDSRLEPRAGIQTVRFKGWSELVGETPKKAMMHLAGPKKDDIIAVIALIDFYGPTFDYPEDKTSTRERCRWAKERLEGRVGHPRFRQFFAVHETEAWLLSNPDLFPSKVRNAFPEAVQNPETVNANLPPAKLLERLYREKTGRTYKKVTDGRDLFGKLDPDIPYQKCPALKELLDEMLDLGKAAGL